MNSKRITRSLLLYESVSFVCMIVVSWLDELIGLPALLFGGSVQSNWREAALESAIILAAAIPTLLLTRRLARRLIFVEGFLHVCAWCRRINVNGQWIPVEQYFKTELNADTSHGICQECSAKVLDEHRK